MWLKTLERLGARINDEWHIFKEGMHTLHLITAPVQEVVQWITEASNRLHIKKAARKRTGLSDLAGYDHKATVVGRPHVDSKPYPYWLMLKTGAFWTETDEATVDVGKRPTCVLCGEEQTGVAHIVCECDSTLPSGKLARLLVRLLMACCRNRLAAMP